jgi:hypothetical protein
MKEADKIPLEMPLGALKSYALNIKKAAANPGKSEDDDKGAALRIERPKRLSRERREVTVTKNSKRPRNQFLKVKIDLLVLIDISVC